MKSYSCCDDSTPEAFQAKAILGLCARVEGNTDLYCRLIVETDSFTRWEKLPALAERHGLGPLVYTHLKAADALTPSQTMREIKALFLRHRHANAVRGEALAEILDAFQSEEIESLFLKGAALAYLVYPQPGLRPMRDMDILVKKTDIQSALSSLEELGYSTEAWAENNIPQDHHHIPGVARKAGGLTLSVEIHHDLFPETRYYKSRQFDDLIDSAIPFQVHGVSALTLGYEDMLYHVYRHACGPPLLASPLRFVWVADIVSLVEKFSDEIDWEKLKSLYPHVVNILPALHFLTPFPESLVGKLGLNTNPRPKDVGCDFQGWPRRRLAGMQWKKRRAILMETLFPPEWWLRLFYGVGGTRSWIWNRWVRHPLHLLEWVGHYSKEGIQTRI
jgi:hypothetical protein